MSRDQEDPARQASPPPTAADFDQVFSAAATSAGLRRVWELAVPDLPRLLRDAGFTDVDVEAQPEWHDLFTRVYRTAIDLGDPHDDAGLASLQDEARRRLPEAGLMRRIVVTATAPG
jgi:hypothetical protein